MATIITQTYTHITDTEREIIARLRYMHCSIRETARMLGRSPATISREIKRNGGVRVYDEDRAICKAKKRWKETHTKQRLSDEQKKLVHKYLELYYSPEQIAGTLALEHSRHKISHESIYLYIYKKAPHLIHCVLPLKSQVVLRSRYLRYARGDISPNLCINQSLLYDSIKIPLPPLEKQNQIAEHISQIRQQAKQLQTEAKTELEQAKQEIENMILGDV